MESDRKPAPRPPRHARRLLGLRVDCSNYSDASEHIASLAIADQSAVVCVANVHMVMEAVDDAAYRRTVNASELITSDGMPLVWSLRRLGLPEAERVYGPTLTPRVCERAAHYGIPVGFYGGTPDILARLETALRDRIPALQIAFAHAPPFRDLCAEEDADIVNAIEESGARILFVGLGCPKQERWMAAHRERLRCTMVGVGAAFDFLAGAKRQAPGWMQRRGLEWLFRLATEPRRLGRRYLWHNPRFVYGMARQLLGAGRHGDESPEKRQEIR